MLARTLSCAAVLAVLALGAPKAAFADGKPSLIRHSAVITPWKVVKEGDSGSGKCKIYAQQPKYDKNNRVSIETPYVKQLKANGDSFTFERDKDYWIIYFPKIGRMNVKLHFIKGHSDPATNTTLKVVGTYVGDTFIGSPSIEFATGSANKAKCNPGSFQKGAAFLSRPAEAFLTLD